MFMRNGFYQFSCVKCPWRGGEDTLTYLLPPFGVGVGIPVCPECGGEVSMVESEDEEEAGEPDPLPGRSKDK